VNGVGDTPNMHDMLTGSDSKVERLEPPTRIVRTGRAIRRPVAMLGHHDRTGGGVVERCAPISWLRSAPRRDWRRGSVLLFCRELALCHPDGCEATGGPAFDAVLGEKQVPRCVNLADAPRWRSRNDP
jgi:hypothetical protein